MTKKEALAILGLPEKANRYEIETRYNTLSRAYFRDRSEDGQAKIRAIIEAYDLLSGRKAAIEKLRNPRDEEMILGVTRAVWKNRLAYGWRPAFAVLLILAVLTSIIYTVITNHPADFDLTYVGAFSELDSEDADFRLAAFLNPRLPEIKNPQRMVLSFYQGMDPQTEQAMMTKRSLLLAAAQNSDIMVMDAHQFPKIAAQGFLLDLDHYFSEKESSFPQLFAKCKRALAAREEQPEGSDPDAAPVPVEDPKTYGIDLGKTSFFGGLGVYGDHYILGLPVTAKHPEAAKKILDLIFSDAEELQKRFEVKSKELIAKASKEAAEYAEREAARESKREAARAKEEEHHE